MIITRDQLTIEHGTSPWGGPTIRISLPNALVAPTQTWNTDKVRVFELKHTAGLDRLANHGWHVHDDVYSWFGVLDLDDADGTLGEAAIDQMVEFLNDLATRDRLSDAMESVLSDLREALEHFGDSLGARSFRGYGREWQRVVDAVTAADIVFQEHAS